MPYDKISDAPPSWRKHKGALLTLAQVNHLARIFDALKHKFETGRAMAIAWSQWEKLYKLTSDGWRRREEKMSEELAEFEPPKSGEAPAEVKKILDEVYSSCRQRWVDEHPNDVENVANKESCARIAWDAVKKAGYVKKDGQWVKESA